MIADRRMWTFLTPAYWRRGTRYRIRRWRQLIRSQEAYHFIIRTRDENKFVGEIALHSVNLAESACGAGISHRQVAVGEGLRY